MPRKKKKPPKPPAQSERISIHLRLPRELVEAIRARAAELDRHPSVQLTRDLRELSYYGGDAQ